MKASATSEERANWLAVAKDVCAGKFQKESRSWKESIWIGMNGFKGDPAFRPAIKIIKEQLDL